MMPTLDSKWLEILKASGWQTGAIAIASGCFLWAVNDGHIPKPDDWVIQLIAFIFLICGILSLASIISALIKFISPHKQFLYWRKRRHEVRTVKDYIPFMTEREKTIIAYLLEKNQKTFIAASDGGHAMPLISRGIVMPAIHPGQIYDHERMPMIIPDHIWDVLSKHREKFPYKPIIRSGFEVNPWRISWMAR